MLVRLNSLLLRGLFDAGMESGDSVLRTFSSTNGAGEQGKRRELGLLFGLLVFAAAGSLVMG